MQTTTQSIENPGADGSPSPSTLQEPRTTHKRFIQLLTVNSPLGLHLRPAALVAKVASGYSCDITIQHAGQEANARSLLSIVMLQAGPGAVIQVETHGHDAREAMNALESLFATGFGE